MKEWKTQRKAVCKKYETFKCKVCGKHFSSMKEWETHWKTVHQKDEQFKCKVCGEHFPSIKEWGTHVKSMCKNEEQFKKAKELLKCKECGKCFSSKFNLKRHSRVHTGEKPFQCEECGNSFTYKVQLLKHQITHAVKKPFECEDCGLKFSSESYLTIHSKICRTCRKCGKPFSLQLFSYQRKENYCKQKESSSKSHAVVGSNQCCECGRCFTDKFLLKDHINDAHQSISFVICNKCGKTFKKAICFHKTSKPLPSKSRF